MSAAAARLRDRARELDSELVEYRLGEGGAGVPYKATRHTDADVAVLHRMQALTLERLAELETTTRRNDFLLAVVALAVLAIAIFGAFAVGLPW